MNIQLTQKETMLLQDQKSHEELCIKKYTEAANQASCSELKQMFQTHAQHETQHLNTVNQILSGTVPTMSSGQSGGSGGQSGMQSGGQSSGQQSSSGGQSGMQSNTQSKPNMGTGSYNQKDKDLCDDLLTTEKYISSTYNTAIFECVDPGVRQALNHIQKEEQEHGEEIFKYMQSKGMYTPK